MSENSDNTQKIINRMINDIPFHILLEEIYKDDEYNKIYMTNKNMIYSKKVKMDFNCINSAEQIYNIVKNSKSAYSELCKRKRLQKMPYPKDMGEYIKDTFTDLYEGSFIMSNVEKIPYAITIFTNFYDLHKQIKDKSIWEEMIEHLITFQTIFYETANEVTYPYLRKMVDDFFNDMGKKLYSVADTRYGIDVEPIRESVILQLEEFVDRGYFNDDSEDFERQYVTFRALGRLADIEE